MTGISIEKDGQPDYPKTVEELIARTQKQEPPEFFKKFDAEMREAEARGEL